MSALADELGITELTAEVRRLGEQVAALEATKPFYKVAEVCEITGLGDPTIRKAIRDGLLWKVEGLDTSTILIPKAALDAWQERPGGQS